MCYDQTNFLNDKGLEQLQKLKPKKQSLLVSKNYTAEQFDQKASGLAKRDFPAKTLRQHFKVTSQVFQTFQKQQNLTSYRMWEKFFDTPDEFLFLHNCFLIQHIAVDDLSSKWVLKIGTKLCENLEIEFFEIFEEANILQALKIIYQDQHQEFDPNWKNLLNFAPAQLFSLDTTRLSLNPDLCIDISSWEVWVVLCWDLTCRSYSRI